jgi:hypothetical protein
MSIREVESEREALLRILQPIDLLRLQSNEGADTFVLPGLR